MVEDPDFGYYVATGIDGVDDDRLQPRKLYEAQGRREEYDEIVAALKATREEYLSRFTTLDPRVAKAAD